MKAVKSFKQTKRTSKKLQRIDFKLEIIIERLWYGKGKIAKIYNIKRYYKTVTINVSNKFNN